jgi:toxin ParE1/3/4
MGDKKYQLRYLPLFEQDLIQTVRYISNELQNPDAAEKWLIAETGDSVE